MKKEKKKKEEKVIKVKMVEIPVIGEMGEDGKIIFYKGGEEFLLKNTKKENNN
ncbi:MAG: hypothetical protein RR191_05440 [Cetobacterium sp.]|uniref:hypothetical protein n=1 Tax=Cetobacterium sp. TaxID=2071632 RepID=UPI002FC6B7F4